MNAGNEHVSAQERDELWNPAVGDGTPETASEVTPDDGDWSPSNPQVRALVGGVLGTLVGLVLVVRGLGDLGSVVLVGSLAALGVGVRR